MADFDKMNIDAVPPSAASTIYGGDVHVYSPEDQTITITGR